MQRTIYALCTPPLNGALHVIRLCGPESFSIANKICRTKVERIGQTLQHNFIVEEGKVIDEVVLAKFVAPRSFTGEDTVEINCHGGMAVVGAIVTLLESRGAKQAQRGEFTRMALLNGKLDLVQAEAVDAIVRAPSKEAVLSAGRSLSGETSSMVAAFKKNLLAAMALIEVSIDYPEYDEAAHGEADKLLAILRPLSAQAAEVVSASRRSIKAFSGLSVAIVGLPNSGKSSLLNALLGENKAIVSPVAGTTRDLVEGSLLIDGVPIRLVDTAGIRKTKGRIESIGVAKAKEQMGTADLVLVLLDGSKKITAPSKSLIESLPEEKRIVVKTKSDLPQKCAYPGISISAMTGNLKELYASMHKAFGRIVVLDGGARLLTERQIGLMQSAAHKVDESVNSLENGATGDLAAQPLAEALSAVKGILGEEYADDLLDELFARFCLGK